MVEWAKILRLVKNEVLELRWNIEVKLYDKN